MEAETNGIIDLSAQGLANPLALKPLIKTLNYQSSVNTLILSNCQLHRSSDVFKMICTLMPTLDNLKELDLSNNGLAPTNFTDLFTSLRKLRRLSSLNLSLNFLTNSVASHVSQLFSSLSDLRELRVRSCFITGDFFDGLSRMDNILYLDVSFNRLGVRYAIRNHYSFIMNCRCDLRASWYA